MRFTEYYDFSILDEDKNEMKKQTIGTYSECRSVNRSDAVATYGFGYNEFGQVGNGSTENKFTPSVVMMLHGKDVAQVAAGELHSIAITRAHPS